jgi:hypothetical protein
MRADDKIVLTTYGRSSGFCVDPVEKKPLNHPLDRPTLLIGLAARHYDLRVGVATVDHDGSLPRLLRPDHPAAFAHLPAEPRVLRHVGIGFVSAGVVLHMPGPHDKAVR